MYERSLFISIDIRGSDSSDWRYQRSDLVSQFHEEAMWSQCLNPTFSSLSQIIVRRNQQRIWDNRANGFKIKILIKSFRETLISTWARQIRDENRAYGRRFRLILRANERTQVREISLVEIRQSLTTTKWERFTNDDKAIIVFHRKQKGPWDHEKKNEITKFRSRQIHLNSIRLRSDHWKTTIKESGKT